MRSDYAWSPRQQCTPSTALLASLLRLDLSRGACGGNAQPEWDSCTAGIPESPHLCPQVPEVEGGLRHAHWSLCQLELTRVNSQPPRKWCPSVYTSGPCEPNPHFSFQDFHVLCNTTEKSDLHPYFRKITRHRLWQQRAGRNSRAQA